MQQEDKNAGPVVSALVLVAAALFTANVYMIYDGERQVSMYEEIEGSYGQTASIFMSLREAKEQATTTDEAVMETGEEEVPVLE